MATRRRSSAQIPAVAARTSSTTPRLMEPVHIPQLEVRVELEAGQPSSRTLVITGDVLRIGSHGSNDLVLVDPMVSRFHCEISRGPGGFRLTDNRSLNGTRLGDFRVRDADLTMPETRIALGESAIVVRDAGWAPAAPIVGAMSLGALKGASEPMRKMYQLLQRAARTDATVLIEGESGTGKELITSEIVRRSKRSAKPFIVVDCGAIAPNVIESELFGHARGAFTGAERQREGVFEAANGGTVFLDEIGELPLEMQPKLLRILETGELRRVGENQLRKVNVRVIAATNRRLEREVNHGRFREDLFFRLSVVTVRVPPLRDRLTDIPLLVDAMLASLDASDKRSLFTPEILDAMAKHDWPGNVRELKNFVERRVVFEESSLDEITPISGVTAASVPPPPPKIDIGKSFRAGKDEVVDAFEKQYLSELLTWANGNVSLAARKSKIDRMHLHRLLQLHGFRKSGSLAD